MAVTAKQLSKSGARGKDLDAVVREHLQIIDDKLLRADRTWGRNVVTHDLPTSMSIPGLDKKDAQRIVYSSILRSLDKRGFEARILLEDDITTLYIVWTTDLDGAEIEAMNAMIKAKRVDRESIAGFLERHKSSSRRVEPMRVVNNGIVLPRGGMQLPVRSNGMSAAEKSIIGSSIIDGS
jgi:hypothetical protein